MPSNVEVKAVISDVEEIIARAKVLAVQEMHLEQSDVFFGSLEKGVRLKLRCEKDRDTQEEKNVLIAYERPDKIGPKCSHYVMSDIKDPTTLETCLAMSNGIEGRVDKKRDVFIAEWEGLTARVHVDRVKELGNYIEFEVIVPDSGKMKKATEFAENLSIHFGLRKEDHIEGAYMNLIHAKDAGRL